MTRGAVAFGVTKRRVPAVPMSASLSSAVVEVEPPPPVSTGGSPEARRRPIYVAATRQHVGKTTVSLALVSGLRKRFDRVGFLKPVGQISLQVREGDRTVCVDKDAALIKQHFGLHHLQYQHTSPVLIPAGYTKSYLDGLITSKQQVRAVRTAYRAQLDAGCSAVVCEGTGHVAVGSIVDASNADMAALLGARMVLVVNGGLGNSFDELALNKSLCDAKAVDLAGVIINKVKPDKYDQTVEYMTRALEQKWGQSVPLLGCIPDRPFLGSPALADLERLLDASLVSGAEHRLRHYRQQDVNLVATSLNVFLRQLREQRGRTLYVCHASRNDILLGYLMESVQRSRLGTHQDWETAMVVTGCDEHPISTQVLEIVTGLPRAPPVLMTRASTDQVMLKMTGYTPKLNSSDEHRVAIAVEHYEPYIDFDLLLERCCEHEEPEPVQQA
jgi:BioD-like phosphotransacetylase family protein